MQKALVLILVVILIICAAEVIYYLSISSKKTMDTTAPITTSSPTPVTQTIPTPVTSFNEINIAYQKTGDTTGRSIFYTYKDASRRDKGFEGINMFYYTAMPFMVGQLEKITAVPGSDDWYVYLKNPLKNTEIGKVRVTLGKTLMAIEHLDKPGIISLKNKDKLKSAVTIQDLQTLVPNTDALVALISVDKKGAVLTDKEGAFLTEVLASRQLSL